MTCGGILTTHESCTQYHSMNALSRNAPPDLERLDATLELVQALNQSLCILDTETTGFARTSGVAELAYIWLGRDGSSEAFSCLLNPEMEIPFQAERVHGISNEMVANAPTYESVAPGVAFIFDNAVLSGFNVKNYDIPVLLNANERYGYPSQAPDALDVRDLWRTLHRTTKGNLIQVAEHYQVTPGAAHEGMGDVITTARVLEAMIRHHGIDVVLDCLDVNRERNRALTMSPA